MIVNEVARTWAAVAGEPSRLGKVELLAACLRRAPVDEVEIAVAFLAGELRQRQIGVGWAALRAPVQPAAEATLTLTDVDATFERIGACSGPGSQQARADLLGSLLTAATAEEQEFLRRLLLGELRQGALDGVMADAIARAADVPGPQVRRALMLRGQLGPVAAAALTGGETALREFGLVVGQPIRPMLAGAAPSVEDALGRFSPAAVEWKLDGIRVQAHRAGDEVRVFTRSLDEITDRVPEVVAAVRALPVAQAVLDGEAIALRPDGRPHPFQVTASRTGSRREVARLRDEVPLPLFLFDLLHLDGDELLDAPSERRSAELARIAPAELIVPRLVTADPASAADFLADALARGHEGVVVKSLDTPYTAGRRGAGWLKVKPRHTLDLVVLAAEWGHGRRQGMLSNLHLGARDEASGGFVMLGKTFKGMTDEMLRWQTERLQALAERREGHIVRVRPELVVEVAFDGLQTSPRYPAGLTLRFARVLRHRTDKSASEADTIEAVRELSR